MCDLCTTDLTARQAAAEDDVKYAEMMEMVADAYRRMAAGSMSPHGEEAMSLTQIIREIVNELDGEWL